jgi:polyferredoxin
LRILVQVLFTLTCVLLGIQLASFYTAAQAGTTPLPHRPPGVEGFLPISGLMGILDWVYQGALNTIHPAATVLLLIAVASALLLRKSFCSWICPVGFLSEGLARIGRRVFGRNFRVWKWLDIPLRGLKYLVLAFFGWAVFTMSAEALQGFILSPYNRVADIKMGLFFVDLGQVGITVMVVLVLLSVLIQGAWCRYLCPYGALLGLFSWLSPVKVRREPANCVDCSLCDRVCMARLPVSKLGSVRSAECTGCLDCLAVCPVEDTLSVQAGRRRLGVPAFAAAVMLLFLAGYIGARATGNWDNEITDREYVERIRDMRDPEYAHPGS